MDYRHSVRTDFGIRQQGKPSTPRHFGSNRERKDTATTSCCQLVTTSSLDTANRLTSQARTDMWLLDKPSKTGNKRVTIANPSALVWGNVSIGGVLRWQPLEPQNFTFGYGDYATAGRLIHVEADIVFTLHCDAAGKFFENSTGICHDCSSIPCSFCPGGDRIWPKAGCWSPNEQTMPTTCLNPQACPGAVDPNGIPFNLGSAASSNGITTDLCADGYTGLACSKCAAAYYQAGLLCLSCGLASSERAELIATIFAAAAFFIALALGVAFLSDRYLIRFVATVMTLQQLVVVAKMATPQIGSALFAQIVNAAGITNFDVQFVKPGCSVPQIDFITLVWITLAFIMGAAVVFVLAAMLRAAMGSIGLPDWCLNCDCKCKKPCSKEEDVSPVRVIDEERPRFCTQFHSRAVHSLVILGNVVYLQITTRCIQGLDCVLIPSGSHLQVELDIQCYSPRHKQLAGVLWVILFLFCIGFPAFCLYTLIYRIKGHTGEKKMQDFLSQYGYLFRDVKERFIWFRWVSFCTNFVLSVQSVLNTSTLTRVFSSAFIFLVEFCLVTVLHPFDTKFNSIVQALSGLANCVQVVFFLAFLNDSSPLRSKLFLADLTFVVVMVTVVVSYRVYVECKRPPTPDDGQSTPGSFTTQNPNPTSTLKEQQSSTTPVKGRPSQLLVEEVDDDGEIPVETKSPKRTFTLEITSPSAAGNGHTAGPLRTASMPNSPGTVFGTQRSSPLSSNPSPAHSDDSFGSGASGAGRRSRADSTGDVELVPPSRTDSSERESPKTPSRNPRIDRQLSSQATASSPHKRATQTFTYSRRDTMSPGSPVNKRASQSVMSMNSMSASGIEVLLPASPVVARRRESRRESKDVISSPTAARTSSSTRPPAQSYDRSRDRSPLRSPTITRVRPTRAAGAAIVGGVTPTHGPSSGAMTPVAEDYHLRL